MARIGLILALLVALAGAYLAYALSDRPDLNDYRAYFAPANSEDSPGVSVVFLGVSTLLVSDGETSLMTDGFFSRPGLLDVALGEIAPDPNRIAAALSRAGVTRLAAIIPVHSHYDHALDTPEVARRTGALVLGSESTANIARGWGLEESQIRVVESGVPLQFGRFTLTPIQSRHVNFGYNEGTLGGTIDAPLEPPAPARAYEEGVTYSVHIAHPEANLLIHGSAGWEEGMLDGMSADVVFLGVGGLGMMDPSYREAYFEQIVTRVGARRVFPIHYDDFTTPLQSPLKLMPNLLGDVPTAFQDLLERCNARSIEFQILPIWQKLSLTSGS